MVYTTLHYLSVVIAKGFVTIIAAMFKPQKDRRLWKWFMRLLQTVTLTADVLF